MQLYIQRLKSYCLALFEIFQKRNKINYGDFKTPIEDIKAPVNLQYLPGAKQPHNFHGKGESCYVLTSLTAIWQFTSVCILKAEASNDSCEP